MGFILVQWENENSASVVNEKKVVGAVEMKEGTTVDILIGTNKVRVAIWWVKLRYSLRDQNLIKE